MVNNQPKPLENNSSYLLFLIFAFFAISGSDFAHLFEIKSENIKNFWDLAKLIFLALGFVLIALRWEDLAKNNIYLIPIIISATIFLTSVFWSLSPLLTIQASIIHLVIWVFALSISLNYNIKTFILGVSAFALFAFILSLIQYFNGSTQPYNFIYFQILIGAALWFNKSSINIACSLALIIILLFGIATNNPYALNIFIAFAIISLNLFAQKYMEKSNFVQLLCAVFIILYAIILFAFALKNNSGLVSELIKSNIQNNITGIGFGLSDGIILKEFILGLGFLGLFYSLFIFSFVLLKFILFKTNRIDFLLLPLFGQLFLNPNEYRLNGIVFVILLIAGFFSFKNARNYDFKDSAAKIAR